MGMGESRFVCLQMRVGEMKNDKNSHDQRRVNQVIDRDNQLFLSESHVHHQFLLTMRSPQKTGKLHIHQLFKNDRLDGIPVFPFASPRHIIREMPYQSRDICSTSPKKVEFNIRNLISRSTHQVPSKAKQDIFSPQKTRRTFRINQSRANSRDLHVQSLHEMRHKFLNISEQLGLIANLKDHSREFKAIREAVSERSNHSARNTAKSGERKRMVVNAQKERAQKLRIIPWEKSFQTQQDNFLQA